MRAAPCLVVIALVILATSPARADEGGQLILEARTAWTIIGTKHPTGGFTPSAAATYVFPLGSGAGLGLGADFGVFGFGGAPRWIGVLGGPTARLLIKGESSPLALSLAFAADFGRVPICTRWEHPICPRFVGLFPSASAAGAYVFDSGVMVGASFAVRIVNSPIGLSVGFEPGLTMGVLLTRK